MCQSPQLLTLTCTMMVNWLKVVIGSIGSRTFEFCQRWLSSWRSAHARYATNQVSCTSLHVPMVNCWVIADKIQTTVWVYGRMLFCIVQISIRIVAKQKRNSVLVKATLHQSIQSKSVLSWNVYSLMESGIYAQIETSSISASTVVSSACVSAPIVTLQFPDFVLFLCIHLPHKNVAVWHSRWRFLLFSQESTAVVPKVRSLRAVAL